MRAHLHAIAFTTPSDQGIFGCVHIRTHQVHIRTHFSPFGSQIERPGHTLFSGIACTSARNAIWTAFTQVKWLFGLPKMLM